ncbi:MAG: lipid-A-disaccharide synthase-related protein [Halanaerobiales bacterium]|nr:lipid-A-disaccharide synthase-related protein [Halanaerobiales bacterium]
MEKIFIVSNGHGEDMIAAKLIRSLLKKDNSIDIKVLPIVGEGKYFNNLPLDLIGPKTKLPSGGFARNSVLNFFKDIKSGLVSKTYRQIKTLRKIKNKVDITIVIGDIYALVLTGLFKGGKVIFLPTAKSEYINGHYKIEKYLMKRYAEMVLPRDKKTEDNLNEYGLKTNYFGNLMMDCFDINNIDFKLREDSFKVGLLPGSREDSYRNLIDFIKVIDQLEKIKKSTFDFLTPVTGDFSLDILVKKIKDIGWKVIDKDSEHIKLQLISKSKNSIISIIHNGFGDVLAQSEVFIGMAGTANEQAVGMGKPVITFPGTGLQFNFEFAADQKMLLGDGVKLIKRDFKKVAYALVELLEDEEEYLKRSKAGQSRMGKRGAVDKTAEKIFEMV